MICIHTILNIKIDTGYEHSLKDVERKLNQKNIKLSDIQYVFLTHAHDDHAGFLNELLGKNNDMKVITSDKSMPILYPLKLAKLFSVGMLQ